MEYKTLTQVVGLVILLSAVLALDAHSGTGSIVARDTDNVSDLRNKLTRLSNLLSLLDNVDENDLQKVAEQNQGQLPPKTPLVSEDMGTVDVSQDAPALPSPPKSQQKPVASQQRTRPLVPEDSSIQVLAKALARLKEPNYNNEDSTGDHLGSDNNESGSDDQKTLDMEQMLERALARLDQDKMNSASSKKPSGGLNSGLVKTPDSQGNQAKEKEVKVIESRLMQDILFANELGISVDDLIRDLDNRASKEVSK